MRDHSRPNSKRGRAALLTAALIALGLTLHAAPSGAVIVHVGSRTLSYEPGPRTAARALAAPRGQGTGKSKGGGGGNSALVTYHGGPVMPANTNYTFFWAPGGAGEYPAGFEEGIDRFFENLAHDSGLFMNTDSILTQYSDNTGHSAAYNSHFGAQLIDTAPYPANGCTAAAKCLTDTQIRTELLGYVQAHGLPIDLEHEYFVLTPEGVEDCMEAASLDCSYGTKLHSYCAYHSHIEVGAADLVYAVDPLIRSCDITEKYPNGNVSDAVIAGGLAHEHSESLTDPIGKGWYDGNGEEVADKCRTTIENGKNSEWGTLLGETPQGPYNEVIDGHFYLYQMMWSNSAGECRQRVGELPTVTSVAPKAGSWKGGQTVTITGTGFAEPASVSFGAASSPSVHVDSSKSLTAVVPEGTPGKVKVTVTTPGGTSPVSKKAVYKYKSH